MWRNLLRITSGEFAFAAPAAVVAASAAAAAAGTSADAAFCSGIAAFTPARGGPMYAASIGARMFDYVRK